MVNYPFLAEFGMFTGIFVILFWSYQRLIDSDNDEIVTQEAKDEDHKTEFLSIDKDVIDVFFKKSESMADLPVNLEEQVEEIRYDYAADPGSVFGTIEFPTLARKVSILQGTGELQLRKGVGHFEKSAKPGEDDHCVLVGHHETMLHGIETLKSGDTMIVKTSKGVFTYQVTDYQSTPLSKTIAIHQCDYAKLTVTTAHPFDTSVSTTSRHTVSADMITSILH